MINFDDALNIILSTKIKVNTSLIPSSESAGRICSSDIRSKIDFPSENNSAMDGYALKSNAAEGAYPKSVIKLKINKNTIYAGSLNKHKIGTDEAVKIMTGGHIPVGFDAVIPLEKTKTQNNFLLLDTPVKKGLNVRLKGEDIKRDDVIIPKNTKLSYTQAALIAACNVKKIRAYENIPASIISTGNEIISIDKTYKYGKVINSNGILAESFMSNNGCRILKNVICKDRLSAIKKEIESALITSKIIITSAGASFGEKDFTEKALMELGLKIKFRQVAIKPAKPFSFGLIDKIPIFMVPGNPVAFFICLIIFIKPFIEKQLHFNNPKDLFDSGAISKINSVFHKKHNRREFIPARTFIENGCLFSEVYKKIGPAMISSFGNINSIISIPEETTEIKAFEDVNIYFI
jgi:molybdopterin molybdotransferase